MKKIIVTLLGIVFLSLISPAPAKAFLPPDILTLVFSSGIPYIIGLIVTFLAQILILVKKNKKHIKIILLSISLFLLAFIGYKFFTKISQLKNINEVSTNEEKIFDEKKWQQLTEYLQANNTDNIIELFKNPDMKMLMSADREISLQDAIENQNIKLIDIHCLDTPIQNSIPACKLAWGIYESFDNQEKINSMMAEYGLSKDDEIVAYCEGGYFSSAVSYILSMHGYNVKYAKLFDIENPNLIEPTFGKSANNIVIQPYEYNPNDKLSYLLINHSDQLLFSYDGIEEYDRLRNQVWVYEAIKNLSLTMIKEQKLPHFVGPVNEENKNDIINSKIICQDKIHCFLTKYYLAYLEIDQSISDIYCLDCTRTRLSND